MNELNLNVVLLRLTIARMRLPYASMRSISCVNDELLPHEEIKTNPYLIPPDRKSTNAVAFRSDIIFLVQ